MTEAEWLARSDHRLMWAWLVFNSDPAYRAWASARKRRLFEAACCRRWWHLLADARSRRAVEVSEHYADGLARAEDLQAAAQEANAVREACPCYALWSAATAAYCAACEGGPPGVSDSGYAFCTAGYLVQDAMRSFPWPIVVAARRDAEERERRVQSRLFLDVFGNPFWPVRLERTWRTPMVLGLARAAYEERDLPGGTLEPGRLAVLADALEETGCSDTRLLTHLRGPGPHVRGCWALDLLLGKT